MKSRIKNNWASWSPAPPTWTTPPPYASSPMLLPQRPSQQHHCPLAVAWEEKHHELQLVPDHAILLGSLSPQLKIADSIKVFFCLRRRTKNYSANGSMSSTLQSTEGRKEYVFSNSSPLSSQPSTPIARTGGSLTSITIPTFLPISDELYCISWKKNRRGSSQASSPCRS